MKHLVIHADDLGMSHGANAAFVELSKLGVCTSGSIMVPCPWFPEIRDIATADPSLDLGVHLTLTSEMKTCRWRPLTKPSPSAGLTDSSGYFHADVASLRRTAVPEAVEAELRAQIDQALASGIDVTHFDDHAGAVLAPEFMDVYIRLGIDYRLPILLTNSLTTYGGIHNLVGVDDNPYRAKAAAAKKSGFRIFDRIIETPWHPSSSPEKTYKSLIGEIADGLTFMAMHFTVPGDVQYFDTGFHQIRTGEYALFKSPAFRSWLKAQDLDLIGMRGLRDEYREMASPRPR